MTFRPIFMLGLVLIAALSAPRAPLFAAEEARSRLERATAAITDTPGDSDDEAQALAVAIAAAQAIKPLPPAPSAALDAAARGTTLAETAKSHEDFAQAAATFARAARAAPWIAEYHFDRARMLVKAERNADAARAYAVYLAAAPDARDRTEVAKLIAVLRNAAPGAGKAMASRQAGEVFRDCPNCPEMVVIPAGNFRMGSPATEKGRFDAEGPQHAVAVRAFALSKFNVTEAQFSGFLGETGYQPEPCNPILDKTWRSPGHGLVTPPGMADLPEQPAICVNWNDVQAYIAWLNKRAALLANPAAPAIAYRLPSEAEWEYAARAATSTSRWWGEGIGSNFANCNGCGSQWDNSLIAPGGSFGPNAFGLYDVLGNVWQWTADCWNESYSGAPADGSAWLAGDCGRRVIRGGSWSNLPVFVRSAARNKADAKGGEFDFSGYVGFRIARALN